MLIEEFVLKKLNLLEAIDPDKFHSIFSNPDIPEMYQVALKSIMRKGYLELSQRITGGQRRRTVVRFEMDPEFAERIKQQVLALDDPGIIIDDVILEELRKSSVRLAKVFINLKDQVELNDLKREVLDSLNNTLSSEEKEKFAYSLPEIAADATE